MGNMDGSTVQDFKNDENVDFYEYLKDRQTNALRPSLEGLDCLENATDGNYGLPVQSVPLTTEWANKTMAGKREQTSKHAKAKEESFKVWEAGVRSTADGIEKQISVGNNSGTKTPSS